MNREEILAMKAGVELDKLIAERVLHRVVKSWETFRGKPVYQMQVPSDYGEVYEHLLCYSTNISAAWHVKEKLNGEGLLLTLTDLCPTGPLHRAEFWGYMGLVPTKMFGKAEADSVPEAICKAALLTRLKGGG